MTKVDEDTYRCDHCLGLFSAKKKRIGMWKAHFCSDKCFDGAEEAEIRQEHEWLFNEGGG